MGYTDRVRIQQSPFTPANSAKEEDSKIITFDINDTEPQSAKDEKWLTSF